MKKSALAIAVVLAACGGEAGPAAPSRPPPSEVLGMAIHVDAAGGDDTFCPALENGLSRSNLTINSDASQPVDARLSCHVFITDDTSLFRVTVNGKTKMKFTVRVEVRAPNNTLVDRFLADYTGYQGAAPDEDVVSKVVLAFAYSPRIAAFARAVKTSRGTAPVATAVPTVTATVDQPNPPADRRDDADWFAIDTVKCKIPGRVEACDGVRSYLRRHPGGTHAQEANEILTAAQPALEKLQKDEVAWQKSNRSECASKRTSDACVGVEAYEIQFPTGVHSEDAHRLLKAAGVDK